VVLPGAVVHEPDHVVPHLAVREDLVGDEAPQLARPDDQDPLEPDAGAPAALERLPDDLRERKVRKTFRARNSAIRAATLEGPRSFMSAGT